MEIVIQPTAEAASIVAAKIIAQLVRRKPDAVLGLATGSTPLATYRELVRMHREDGLDFSRVRTFNLDEYVGLPHEHPQSYHEFMQENLFRHINVPRENIRIPNGLAADVPAECAAYEQAIRAVGGIDLPQPQRGPMRPSWTTPVPSARTSRAAPCRSGSRCCRPHGPLVR